MVDTIQTWIIKLVLHYSDDRFLSSRTINNNVEVINTPTRLKTISISICDLEIPKIYLARKPTFENWLSWLSHQTRGLAHAIQVTNILMNKDSSPTTSAYENSLIHALTPKMLLYVSIKSLNPTIDSCIN